MIGIKHRNFSSKAFAMLLTSTHLSTSRPARKLLRTISTFQVLYFGLKSPVNGTFLQQNKRLETNLFWIFSMKMSKKYTLHVLKDTMIVRQILLTIVTAMTLFSTIA